ncbi:MAG: Uma2 family endonuclease [Lachnospiraceae bacterium]|nr:Uma2 family endonuclease [Lachnospiraceae bacterium]MCX4376391.1 Uma2 family endonuclease [Lachnospiraceae bacterium]
MDAAKVLEESYTIEDIYNLPQGKRAELIDGEIYMMASPSTIHQRLVMALSNRIYNYIDSKQGSCEVFPSPFAVFLNADNEIYLEPDISVICDKSKITDEGCKGAPDWVIEIVSQSSKRMDYYIKLFRYRTAGVKEYWVVDPEKNHVIVYDFEHDEVMDYTFSDKVKAGIYEDLEIDFSEIQME